MSLAWSTPYWRYTLSEWVALIVGAGFTISLLHEPRPTAEQVAANPHLDDCSRMPFFLIVDARKPLPVLVGGGVAPCY